MKKYISGLFSMLTTSVLIVVFAVSIAYATFIENDYGTQAARILVYNAWWFNILLGLLALNLVGGLFYHKAFQLKRWSMILFHLAFVVILVGSGITRFYSYEGMLHIREGESSNQLVSDQAYVQFKGFAGQNEINKDWKIQLSPYANTNFKNRIELGNSEIELSDLHFVPSAIENVVADPNGVPLISLIIIEPSKARKDLALELNNQIENDRFSISFEGKQSENTIFIRRQDNGLVVVPHDSIRIVSMMGESEGTLVPGEAAELSQRKMYQFGTTVFVLKSYLPKGKKVLSTMQNNNGGTVMDAIRLTARANGESKQIVLFGKKGIAGDPVHEIVGGIPFALSFGSKIIELPFEIVLNDFQLERYPGSMSPSSYASDVTLLDKKNDIELPYRIYMNNILDYDGYRFFQSSYDQDEKGTVLSVSHDYAGTAVTYFGYFMMTFGMIFTFFNRKSRFHSLLRSGSRLKTIKKNSIIGIGLLLFLLVPEIASSQQNRIDRINIEHISSFDKLIVQDTRGRVKPVNTIASEVLRKLIRKNKFEGKSASEVFLGMCVQPEAWRSVQIIKVSNTELQKQLGINGKYASFNDLAGMNNGNYKLRNLVDEAYKKKQTERNKFDKEVINVDERVNICYQVFNGDFLRVFPDKYDDNNSWITEQQFYKQKKNQGKVKLLSEYFSAVSTAIQTDNYAPAEQQLQQLKAFQYSQGKNIIPSEMKTKLEIFYNRNNIFSLLFKFCAVLGFYLLIMHLLQIFNSSIHLRKFLVPGVALVSIAFLIFSAGLALRWYISGHAPWSNGYETMLYIAWATMLSGFIFLKRSPITLAVTTILSSLILMVAGMSWMNPEITNLVPVLKSYWLIIHVAIITASYGFLGIAALLGFLNLILMVIRNPKNIRNASFTIVEVSIIIELALIIGLILLTVGAFIGAIWANESWGRYWGWDPKETWALITILVYSFIIHLRKVPGMFSNFILSTLSLVGFSSVLMTFFGVNYYLSGMHSYAQGDPPPIPVFVYVALVLILVVIVAAAVSEKHHQSADEVVKDQSQEAI